MLAGTTLALQFAEPRTGAAILSGAEAHMVDDLAAIDREVMAADVDRLQQPHLAPGQQFAGIEQARLQGFDAVKVERQFAMKVAAGRPVVAREAARAVLRAGESMHEFPAGPGLTKLAAGWLIERAGWKGRDLGPVGMYEKQALVLVNRGGATGADVTALMRAVQCDVRERFGVELTPEPVFL